jgi:uncharacterized protein (DUF1499 family)
MDNVQDGRRSSAAASLGFLVAVIAFLTALSAGMGTRYELWNFRAGLAVLRWAAYAGVAAAALSLIGIILSLRPVITRNLLWAVPGLIIGITVAAVPWYWMEKAKSLPRIHDITTDTQDPPNFAAILALRKNASNPPDYGGPQIAAQQLKAYPDIIPLILDVPSDKAFEKALEVARGMGWKIVDMNKDAGRIEATDTTFWFGFRDDIVIRIEKNDSGSRLDIRSVSRVGISDIGTNAERIRRFLKEMQKT